MVHAVQAQVTNPLSSPDTSDPARNNISILPVPASRQVRFAHPAEASIADLLDSHNVRWLYEPTTFPLQTSESGLPLQSFTPDFYLPDHDTYIEMTTMRQSLVTRKNRKFRLLRERYPDLNVRLLYRRDVELITDWYRGHISAGAVGAVVVSDETIARRIEDIVQSLDRLAGHQSAVLALGTGATRFAERIANALTRQTGRRARVELLSVKRRAGLPARPVQFELSASIPPGVSAVLAADVVGTGLTAHAALSWLRDRGCLPTGLLALADRRSARLIDLPITGSVVSAPSAWLGGAGIDSSSHTALHVVGAADSQPSGGNVAPRL